MCRCCGNTNCPNVRGLTFGPSALPWIVRTSSTSTTSTQDGRKTSTQPHGASPLAGMDYRGRREGGDARWLGVEGSRALAIRPLGLGMASLPPLSFPMISWPGEMGGTSVPWMGLAGPFGDMRLIQSQPSSRAEINK